MGLTGGGGVVEARACRIDGGNDGILELRERCAQFDEDVHAQRVWVELWRLAHPQLLNNKHLHLNRPPRGVLNFVPGRCHCCSLALGRALGRLALGRALGRPALKRLALDCSLRAHVRVRVHRARLRVRRGRGLRRTLVFLGRRQTRFTTSTSFEFLTTGIVDPSRILRVLRKAIEGGLVLQ